MQLQSLTSVETPIAQPDAEQPVKPASKPSFSASLREFIAGDGDEDQVLQALDRALAAEKSRPRALLRIVSHQNTQQPLPEELLAELSQRIGRHLNDEATDESESNPATSIEEDIANDEATVFVEDTFAAQAEADARADASYDSQLDGEETQYLPPEQTPRAQSIPAIGRVLNNRFILEELVGQGGMSLVYRAIDKRKLEARSRNPQVAVKILEVAAKNKDAAFMALQREVQKSEILYHPNIVRAIDFDRDGDTVFMTLEFLSGQPLSEVIKALDTGGMQVKQAMDLIGQMGAALAHAHKHRIVHADFKPGNVMLTDAGEIRVIDFGIARAYKQPDDPETEKTMFDPRSLGALTPAYASPEMLENLEPDPRDDIYSLGCVAYELLTGHHPFSRARATEARDAGVKPRKPDNLNFRQWRALAKALSFDRQHRSASVDEFLLGLLPKGNLRSALVAGIGAVAAAALIFTALQTSSLLDGQDKQPTVTEDTETPANKTKVAPVPKVVPRVAANALTAGTSIKDCPTCPTLVVLPLGEASIGSAAADPNRREFEGPQFDFRMDSPLAMGTTEVTVAQYQAYVDANPDASSQQGDCRNLESGWSPSATASWQQPGFAQGDSHPVTCVSWQDANQYVAWLSDTTGETYRLPSEAEWEYAAKAGSENPTQTNYWLNDDTAACAQGNFADIDAATKYPGWKSVNCADGFVHTAPVANKQANAFGLFDMQGNLFEWTKDCWSNGYRQTSVCSERVLRGGSWFTEPRDLRFAYRNRAQDNTRTASFGFRVVREVR